MDAERQASDRWHEAGAEIARYGRRLISDGLAYGTAGNLSCQAGDEIVISPTSVPYEAVTPADVWVLSRDGQVVRAGTKAPSSESPFHLAIYAATGAAAVVHTHSAEVVAVSATLEYLPAIHYSIAQLGGPVPVVSYRRFGSDSLADGITAALCGLDRPRSAAIVQNHGAVTYGATLAEAFEKALLLEWLARTYRLARQYGEPRILTTAELDEVTTEARRRRYALAHEGDRT
ncbi:MAG TPA: class II aldolase/adducin family protein [Streptosporangiaceae bacterium]